jgi:hypothetical protein
MGKLQSMRFDRRLLKTAERPPPQVITSSIGSIINFFSMRAELLPFSVHKQQFSKTHFLFTTRCCSTVCFADNRLQQNSAECSKTQEPMQNESAPESGNSEAD